METEAANRQRVLYNLNDTIEGVWVSVILSRIYIHVGLV